MSRKARDPQPQYQGGGFNDSLRSGMSDQLRRLLAADDFRSQQEAAEIERQRAAHADLARERAIASLVAEAIERGEGVTHQQRMSGEGLGRTPSEFVAQRAAIMDMEDAREEARRRSEFNRWQLQQSAAHTYDDTAVQAEKGARAAQSRDVGSSGGGGSCPRGGGPEDDPCGSAASCAGSRRDLMTAGPAQVAAAAEAVVLGMAAAAAYEAAARRTPGVGFLVSLPSVVGALGRPKQGEGYNVPPGVPALRPVAHVAAPITYASPLVAGQPVGGSVGAVAALDGVAWRMQGSASRTPTRGPAVLLISAPSGRTPLLHRIREAFGVLFRRG
jgi:hypothetical protein